MLPEMIFIRHESREIATKEIEKAWNDETTL